MKRITSAIQCAVGSKDLAYSELRTRREELRIVSTACDKLKVSSCIHLTLSSLLINTRPPKGFHAEYSLGLAVNTALIGSVMKYLQQQTTC